MYRYGIAYYQMDGTERKPVTDADVRLLRPGQSWAEGLALAQAVAGSGYYEITTDDPTKLGFYEIWDDQVAPAGAFSGRCCLIGQMDSRGFQNAAVLSNHIADAAVTAAKLAAGSVTTDKLALAMLPASALIYEAQDAADGVGDVSEASPGVIETDTKVLHEFDREYSAEPLIFLTPRCDLNLYISQVTLAAGALSVAVGLGTAGAATTLAYDLIVIAKEG